MKKIVSRNARKMAEDINCVLGKCKNLDHENRMNEEVKIMGKTGEDEDEDEDGDEDEDEAKIMGRTEVEEGQARKSFKRRIFKKRTFRKFKTIRRVITRNITRTFSLNVTAGVNK
jgi:hypothetical protein